MNHIASLFWYLLFLTSLYPTYRSCQRVLNLDTVPETDEVFRRLKRAYLLNWVLSIACSVALLVVAVVTY